MVIGREDGDSCWYQAEDIGCPCNDGGFDSEWEWDEEAGCYACAGCGELQ